MTTFFWIHRYLEKHPKVSKNRDNTSILKKSEIEKLAAGIARELWPSLDKKESRTNAEIEALKKVVELTLETDELKKPKSLQGLLPQISYISGFEEGKKILESPDAHKKNLLTG